MERVVLNGGKIHFVILIISSVTVTSYQETFSGYQLMASPGRLRAQFVQRRKSEPQEA